MKINWQLQCSLEEKSVGINDNTKYKRNWDMYVKIWLLEYWKYDHILIEIIYSYRCGFEILRVRPGVWLTGRVILSIQHMWRGQLSAKKKKYTYMK